MLTRDLENDKMVIMIKTSLFNSNMYINRNAVRAWHTKVNKGNLPQAVATMPTANPNYFQGCLKCNPTLVGLTSSFIWKQKDEINRMVKVNKSIIREL